MNDKINSVGNVVENADLHFLLRRKNPTAELLIHQLEQLEDFPIYYDFSLIPKNVIKLAVHKLSAIKVLYLAALTLREENKDD